MKRKLLLLSIFFGAFSLFVGMGFFLSAQTAVPAAAQSEPDNATTRTIQVSGQGQVTAEPDMAIVRLGVETEADTAVAALEANNENMTAVISATLEAGIDESDIRTEGFRLQPVYDSGSDGQTQALVGYRGSNTVRITVRDLAMLGDLLDTAVSAGSNSIDGIQFQVSDQADLAAAAREAAMMDAMAKAEQLTELAGAALGPVHTIYETSAPRPLTAAVADQAVESASVPVQAGSQTIQVSVQVTWEIQE